jgi:putative colanic acid biosynthesis UDP-glucose lipid carrier transferase
MNNKYINLFRFFFAFIDLLALNLIHIVMIFSLDRIPIKSERNYLYLFAAANILWLLAAYSTALYIDNANPDGDKFARRTVKTFVVFNVLILFFMFIYHYSYSRLFMVSTFVSFFAFLLITRSLLVGISFYMNKVSKTTKKIVIIGYNEIAKTLVQRFASQKINLQVDGYFEDELMVKELSTLPIIGNIDECLDYARNNDINEIYSTISPESNASLYEMVKVAEKSFIRFKFVPDFQLYVNRKTHMEYLVEIPILSLRPEPLEDIGNAIKKRIVDVVFSLFVIVFILSWLVPVMAILIKISSRGPVFFKQLRSGKNNEQFTCYKFRTLRINDDANLKQVTKNDDRITKLGKFLRKSNIDELPQFLNVLLGDMSIVGPRPHMIKHTHVFSKIMNEYMIRHFIKPGVTGWAQVNGYRGEIKEEDQLRKRIEYDIWYMENWSSYLDLKIIWLTIFYTIKGDRNAY